MPKYTYDTEKEAQEALDQARNEWKHFCPIINTICRKDCISYHAGRIWQDTDAWREKARAWRLCYPWCGNVLISGEITVNRE